MRELIYKYVTADTKAEHEKYSKILAEIDFFDVKTWIKS